MSYLHQFTSTTAATQVVPTEYQYRRRKVYSVSNIPLVEWEGMRIPTQHTFVVIRNSLAHKILYTSSKRFSILPKVFASQMAFLFSLILTLLRTCGHHVVEDSYNNYNVFHLYIQLKVHTAARPLNATEVIFIQDPSSVHLHIQVVNHLRILFQRSIF